MARYSAGFRSAAGSTTLPIASLYAAASITFKLVEVGLFNTTATAVALKLTKLSSAGTQGTGLTETLQGADGPAANCTGFNTHSSTGPTLAGDLGYNVTLGAAVGAGVILTFGSRGISVPVGTGNGVGVIVATGTGQVVDGWFVWEEG